MTEPCHHLKTIIETQTHVTGLFKAQNEIKSDIRCIKESLSKIREVIARDEGRYDGEERRKNPERGGGFWAGFAFAFMALGAGIASGVKPLVTVLAPLIGK